LQIRYTPVRFWPRPQLKNKILQITALRARQIFDSRGKPTIEADLVIDGNFLGRASVPSGASKGRCEAVEKRDGGAAYCGNGVLGAVDLINEEISPKLLLKSFTSQADLDEFLINLDGSLDKSRLGANTVLSVSIAYAKAVAKATNESLFASIPYDCVKKLPVPMLNIINGGIHADNRLSIQEFMIVPQRGEDIRQNLRIATEVHYSLKKILGSQGYRTNTGDEGGFAPDLSHAEEALEFILQAIERAGYKPGIDVCLALDCAGNELRHEDGYTLSHTQKHLSTLELAHFYRGLCSRYPIVYIEDPFAEDDYEGWKYITQLLDKKVKIVGDDLFVTNSTKVMEGIKHKLANAVLIKMNQIGTISETLRCIALAQKHNIMHIISHRSGETEDTVISHLAVATGSPYLKAGALSGTDRVCKYNELLRIRELL
jgi:enolase